MRISRGDSNFHEVLDKLQKQYFNLSGDTDAEIIVNWNKREVKEENVVSFYGCNASISNAIRRALGERIKTMPFNQESIKKQLLG